MTSPGELYYVNTKSNTGAAGKESKSSRSSEASDSAVYPRYQASRESSYEKQQVVAPKAHNSRSSGSSPTDDHQLLQASQPGKVTPYYTRFGTKKHSVEDEKRSYGKSTYYAANNNHDLKESTRFSSNERQESGMKSNRS